MTEESLNEMVNNQENEPKEINLSSTAFDTFLRCIGLLQDVCTDIDIQNGFIRQRTNDKSTIFEIDLTTIIEDLSFPLLQLKSKFSLLKLLKGNDVKITLYGNDYFEFSDSFSKFRFNVPSIEYIDNKFMTQEELENLFELFDDDIILSTDINYTISNRIRVVKEVYNTNNVFVEFTGDKASIFSKSDSNDQYATFVNEITTEKEIVASSPLVSIPFAIDHDGDIKLEMFNHQSNISINKFSTNIESVDIILYTRSELVNEEEENED